MSQDNLNQVPELNNPELETNKELESIKADLEDLKKVFSEIEETANQKEVKKWNRESMRKIRNAAKKERKDIEKKLKNTQVLESKEVIDYASNLLYELKEWVQKKEYSRDELLRELWKALGGEQIVWIPWQTNSIDKTTQNINREREALHKNKKLTMLKSELMKLRKENYANEKIQLFLDGVMAGTIAFPVEYNVLISKLWKKNVKKLRSQNMEAVFHLTWWNVPWVIRNTEGNIIENQKYISKETKYNSYEDMGDAFDKDGWRWFIRHALNQTNMTPRQREWWIKAVELWAVWAGLFFGIKWLFGSKEQTWMSWRQKWLAIAWVTIWSQALTGKNPLQLIYEWYTKWWDVDKIFWKIADWVEAGSPEEIMSNCGHCTTFAWPLFGKYTFKDLQKQFNWKSGGWLSILWFDALKEKVNSEWDSTEKRAISCSESEANKKLQESFEEIWIDKDNAKEVFEKLEDKNFEDVFKDFVVYRSRFKEELEDMWKKLEDGWETSKEFKKYILGLVISGDEPTVNSVSDYIKDNEDAVKDKEENDETTEKNETEPSNQDLQNIWKISIWEWVLADENEKEDTEENEETNESENVESDDNVNEKEDTEENNQKSELETAINSMPISETAKNKIVKWLSEAYKLTDGSLEITKFEYPIIWLKSYDKETFVDLEGKKLSSSTSNWEAIELDVRFRNYDELIKSANLTNYIYKLFAGSKDDANSWKYFQSGVLGLTFNNTQWNELSLDTKVANIKKISDQLNDDKKKYADFLNKVVFDEVNSEDTAVSRGWSSITWWISSRIDEYEKRREKVKQEKIDKIKNDISSGLKSALGENKTIEYNSEKEILTIKWVNWNDLKNDSFVRFLDDVDDVEKIIIEDVDFSWDNKISVQGLEKILNLWDKIQLKPWWEFNGKRNKLEYYVDKYSENKTTEKTLGEMISEYEQMHETDIDKKEAKIKWEIEKITSLQEVSIDYNNDKQIVVSWLTWENMNSSDLIDYFSKISGRKFLWNDVSQIKLEWVDLTTETSINKDELKKLLEMEEKLLLWQNFNANKDRLEYVVDHFDGYIEDEDRSADYTNQNTNTDNNLDTWLGIYADMMKTDLQILKNELDKKMQAWITENLQSTYDKNNNLYKITGGLDYNSIQNDQLLANLKELKNQNWFLPDDVDKISIPCVDMEKPGEAISVKYLKNMLDLWKEVSFWKEFNKHREMIKEVVDKFDVGDVNNKHTTKLDLNWIIILHEIFMNNYDFDRIWDGEDDSRIDFVNKLCKKLKEENIQLSVDNHISDSDFLDGLNIEYNVRPRFLDRTFKWSEKTLNAVYNSIKKFHNNSQSNS